MKNRMMQARRNHQMMQAQRNHQMMQVKKNPPTIIHPLLKNLKEMLTNQKKQKETTLQFQIKNLKGHLKEMMPKDKVVVMMQRNLMMKNL